MSDNTAQEKKVYTVSELTRDISQLLEGAFSRVWVEGEVSNFILHTSGHCYLSLKDAESVVACVIFKGPASKLKFTIENGMSLVCSGRIGVYNKRGQYQLYIDKAEPRGVGSLQLAFTQLKERLFKEGLFSEADKKPLPYLPEAIGIVTSPTGAAIRDMLDIIDRRFSNMRVILFPVKVQGEGAASEIVEGIEAFNRLKNVDLIIIGRGGGSLEDLWAFNEEPVARAIYSSEIPLVSAVGHEIDYTIADFVADLRAPTPSAAAELVVRKKDDILKQIDNLRQRLKQALQSRADILKKYLDGIMKRYAFRQPQFLVEQYQQRLDEQQRSLSQSLAYLISMKREKAQSISGRLKALNPTAILSRGYSITMACPSGDIIKDASLVKKGLRIRTKLARGEIVSTVKN
jgi:exodeoxyribonuclease VII large subunit